MSDKMVQVTIEGRTFSAPAAKSIIQAYVFSGEPLTENVGCMGQGVCGSCRCMVRRAGSREVETKLACETLIEEGMQVSFWIILRRAGRTCTRSTTCTTAGRCMPKSDDVFPEATALPPLRRLRSRVPEAHGCPARRQLGGGGRHHRASRRVRPVRHVQPLHAGVPRKHPAEPPRRVRAPRRRLAGPATDGPDHSPTADRTRRDGRRPGRRGASPAP